MIFMEKNNTTQANEANDYAREWYAMMVRIWEDRINRMRIFDTGDLYSSVKGAGLRTNGFTMEAAFKFLQYGVYVDAGVGNGYARGNGGNLEFLDKDYRRAHNLGKSRERRPWFSPSWYISVEVLKDKIADMMGDEFLAAFDDK